MRDMRAHAVMGVVPPAVAEARIAVRWPSVAAYPGPAKLGSSLQQLAKSLVIATLRLPTVLAAVLLLFVLAIATAIAFLGWLLLAPLYFLKILPLFMTRYMLTNRRVMIQKGWELRPVQEVKLEDITEVRVAPGSEQPFYLAADLEVLSGDRVALRLRGVKEYEQFKINIESAYLAWGRKSPPKEQAYPASDLAKIKVQK